MWTKYISSIIFTHPFFHDPNDTVMTIGYIPLIVGHDHEGVGRFAMNKTTLTKSEEKEDESWIFQ
jgi:hypothetical protein